MKLALAGVFDGRIVNIADEAPTTIYELVKLVDEKMEASAEPMQSPWHLHVDVSLARSLGFQPTARTVYQALQEGAYFNLISCAQHFCRKRSVRESKLMQKATFGLFMKGKGVKRPMPSGCTGRSTSAVRAMQFARRARRNRRNSTVSCEPPLKRRERTPRRPLQVNFGLRSRGFVERFQRARRIDEGCARVHGDGNAERFGQLLAGRTGLQGLVAVDRYAAVAPRGHSNHERDELACLLVQMRGLAAGAGGGQVALKSGQTIESCTLSLCKKDP